MCLTDVSECVVSNVVPMLAAKVFHTVSTKKNGWHGIVIRMAAQYPKGP